MIPAVVSTVITAQMIRPTVTAPSQNARNGEWPAQRSASESEPGVRFGRCAGRGQVRVPYFAAGAGRAGVICSRRLGATSRASR